MPKGRKKLALIGVLALGLAAMAAVLHSRTAPPPPDWPAVGRITQHGPLGEATCTGTLIRADLVLTAAHCAAPFEGAAPDRMARLGFAAGLADGQYAAYSPARAVLVAPGYAPGSKTLSRVPGDIALIRLAQPIETIAPIPVSPLMAFDTHAGFVAYMNSAPRRPVERSVCPIALRAEGVLQLGCAVVSGHSGAAVLAGFPDAPRVIGVISARAGTTAFAAATNDWLFGQME